MWHHATHFNFKRLITLHKVTTGSLSVTWKVVGAGNLAASLPFSLHASNSLVKEQWEPGSRHH